MLFGLIVELTDGRIIQIPSDDQWRVAPNDVVGWQKKKEAPTQWETQWW